MTLDLVNINFRCLSCSLCHPDRREMWGRHTVLIVPHVTERLNAPHSSLQKCYYFVDKGIGAIWPNSSVQSQMKLFAGKINLLPPSLPPALVRFGFGFIGIACVTQPSVSLSQRLSQSVLPRKTHTCRNTHSRSGTIQSLLATRSIKN